ncbi:hypothetical protein PORY_000234 [Pneumocystis oryctolagi]|uniref:Uncharacterized protein n=1 Tax=Pneumocystis oryctolagi TaxID=42067 RepID=A0ACB7CEZ6_9ASCO|nr:hypothetical protein PORY_000234 [Pneumocystis oryctolagi]
MISGVESEETRLLNQKSRGNVRVVNAIGTISDKQFIAVVYVSVFIITYCISLESQTTSNFIVPATSYFGKNSLIPLINTINGVLYAVVKQQISKISTIFGRMEGFCFSLLLYDIVGCMMYMMSTNIVAFIISSIFHTIGSTGIQILQQIIIADISNFLNRGLLNSILDIPFLINVWVGPNLAQSIYLPEPASEQWRLGYGIWAIVLSISSLPTIIILYLGQFKTKEIDVSFLKNNEAGSMGFSIKKIFVEFDFIGVVILSLGLVLLLFQLIHEFPIFYNIKSLYIATIFIIIAILCVVFPLWEFYYAKYPILSFNSFKSRAIGLSTYLYVTKSNSIKRVGNVFSFTSTIVAIFVVGIIYMIYNLRVDESVMEMTISQAIIGISGGFYNMSALIGVQATSCHRQVVVNTALFLTLASIGSAVGSAISGIMWSSLLPRMLKYHSEHLNVFLTPTDYSLIIGSPFILDQYSKFVKGTIGRMVIILAYNDVMRSLYICSAICVVPMLLCVMFMEDIHLDKIRQMIYKDDSIHRLSEELKISISG